MEPKGNLGHLVALWMILVLEVNLYLSRPLQLSGSNTFSLLLPPRSASFSPQRLRPINRTNSVFRFD